MTQTTSTPALPALTDAEIDALTGDELRAAVAERVMGYRWFADGDHKRRWLSRLEYDEFGFVPATGNERFSGWKMVPEYDTSLNAAMEVAEKVCPLTCTPLWYWSFVQFADGWAATITDHRTEKLIQSAFAQSLATAICRAALKAVRELRAEGNKE